MCCFLHPILGKILTHCTGKPVFARSNFEDDLSQTAARFPTNEEPALGMTQPMRDRGLCGPFENWLLRQWPHRTVLLIL